MGLTTAAALVHEMMEARDERRLLNLQRQLSRPNLLINNELGFVPLSRPARNLLFEVFSQLYEPGLHPGHHQLAMRRMDRGLRLGAADRALLDRLHPPRQHPENERRELQAQAQQGDRRLAGFR